LSQHVDDPPEEKSISISDSGTTPLQKPRRRVSSVGVPAFFILIGLALILFTAQIIQSLLPVAPASTLGSAQAQPTQGSTATQGSTPTQGSTATQESSELTPASTVSPTPQPTPTSPFFTPGDPAASALQLPAGHYIIYQGLTHIFMISTTDLSQSPIYTPGYTYSQAVRPILTPSNQLLYTGNQGIWLTDPFVQQPIQIFQLESNMQVTSMVLSQDGQTIAWTTEPIEGDGQISIYAGPLGDPQLIRQQSTVNCPCFHLFSFLNGTNSHENTTLLLTDDRGSNGATKYGLWSLDLTNPSADPQLIMDEDPQQGPLLFAPYSNTLLYSDNEQAVPAPTDGSVPADVAALSYANSLGITTIGDNPIALGTSQVILPVQRELANSAQYRWVTTPTFSPDGGTLAYVEFSSGAQDPYDRYSALYTVQVSGSGANLQVGKPQLVATATTKLFELGPWLNSHVVTMYGDGALYALDVQSGSQTLLNQSGGDNYLRILGTIGTGLV
jgi:hypothetical protein